MTNSYMEAIFECGGFPLLLPIKGAKELWHQAAMEMDGFLFTGGGDITPSLYGEETLQCCGEISPNRDAMELDLLSAVLPTGKPILGVCRGIQLLNVGLHGTLYQDIYLQNAQPILQQHTQKLPDHLPAHDIIIEEGSLLHRIEKTTRLPVNTLHHQAVKDCAPGVSIAARSSSGLIEAIEKQDHPFFLGVQWHPERMWHVDTAAKVLFESFVDACSKTL
jgi:putative glutamine amidotransferase